MQLGRCISCRKKTKGLCVDCESPACEPCSSLDMTCTNCQTWYHHVEAYIKEVVRLRKKKLTMPARHGRTASK